MSGPVTGTDTPPVATEPAGGAGPVLEVTDSREAEVGGMRVRRALPRRDRRTVGAWCFADHMGPVAVTAEQGVDIGPHPHIGLHTVTWLVAGEVLHRDSLGSEQVVRPGQLNLMTAGRGVAHAEEATGRYRGDLHGIQLWVAQPERTRHGPPAFEHHAELPRVEIGGAAATVLVGDLAGVVSPARRDTELVGVDLVLAPGRHAVPLHPTFEHAVVVLDGAVSMDHEVVLPGRLAFLGGGRDELALSTTATTRALLLGGVPFEERVLMWWNFVARSRDEVDAARRDWSSGAERFGTVASGLPVIPAPPTPWRSAPPPPA